MGKISMISMIARNFHFVFIAIRFWNFSTQNSFVFVPFFVKWLNQNSQLIILTKSNFANKQAILIKIMHLKLVLCGPELGRTSAVRVVTLLAPHGPDLIPRECCMYCKGGAS